jgi:hypothetical protein
MAMPTRAQLFEILNYTLTFESLQQVQRKLRFPRAPNHITREKLQTKTTRLLEEIKQINSPGPGQIIFFNRVRGTGICTSREFFSL